MNVLAIDSSTEYLSLALQSANGRTGLGELVGSNLSQHLISKINQLLMEHNLAISKLNLIAYNQGPGSFTGLRIGLSVALGIAFGLNIKLVPIPAFALFTLGHTKKLLVALDAKLNQIYLAGINATSLDYFLAPQLINPQQVPYLDDCLLVGNGFNVYHNLLNTKLQQSTVITSHTYPNALAMLDLIKLNKYKACSSQEADLLYLRNKVALTTIEQQMHKLPVN